MLCILSEKELLYLCDEGKDYHLSSATLWRPNQDFTDFLKDKLCYVIGTLMYHGKKKHNRQTNFSVFKSYMHILVMGDPSVEETK